MIPFLARAVSRSGVDGVDALLQELTRAASKAIGKPVQVIHTALWVNQGCTTAMSMHEPWEYINGVRRHVYGR
jgi:hypothetical protein